MKKSETVALHRDAYLLGKDEEAIKRFNEKELEKQYIAIMNWKRKQNAAAGVSALSSTVKDVLAHLKEAHKSLQKLETLSPKDSEKLHNAVEDFKQSIIDFEKIKKQQLIQELKSKKDKLYSEGQDLERKIEALQQELN